MASKQHQEAPVITESASDIANSIFSESLHAIRKEIRGLVDGSIESGKHDTASRIAWLAKNAASVAAEERKAQKAEHNAVLKISSQVVMTWIKGQTPEVRARIVRETAAIDSQRRSVLG